jgi:DNA modification methylase
MAAAKKQRRARPLPKEIPTLPEEQVRLAPLKKHPRNYKKHTDAQLEHIAHNIRREGIWKNVVISRDGYVLAGHGVVEAARKAGVKTAPARRVPVDHDHPRALAIVVADNETSRLADTDNAALASLLKAIGEWDGLTGTGISVGDANALIRNAGLMSENDADAVAPEPPKKPVARPGDIWRLGNHRLLCGDSRSADDVSRLFGKLRSKLVATDPPYNIDYTKSKDGIPRSGFKDIVARFGSIENDSMTAEDFRRLLDDFLARAIDHSDRAATYVWHPSGDEEEIFRSSMRAADVVIHRRIVWVKPGFVLSRSGMYHPAHEDCFYGWRQGQQPPWYGPKNQTTVWQVGRDSGKAMHPTQKPVELFEIPMRNHTEVGEVCYEPFSGSGSQIIAGERLERRVLAMELDPRYVDVAVERWQQYSGGKARRSSTA